jgi:predicted dehydrogenase
MASKQSRKVRWGILSTAHIGTAQVIPAMQQCQYAEVTAIASRDWDRAQAAGSQLGIPKVYSSYEALLDDPDIDAIYNPLPNHLHVPWSIRALQAGKHVLVEKPIALSAAEAMELAAAAARWPHLKVMEAFMYRFHPQWVLARKLVKDGTIGALRTIQTVFSYYNVDANNIRNRADMGGGGLMDIGCYAVSLSRFVFDKQPQRVVATVDYDPNFKTDRMAAGILDFGNGTSAFTCSTQAGSFQRVVILGADGSIEIEIPFNAPPDRPCRLWHKHGGSVETVMLDTVDQYTLQCDALSQAILSDGPVPTPLSDAVANMQVIEALFDSGRRGQWTTLTAA